MLTVAYVINFMKNCGPCNVVRSLLHTLKRNSINPILITLYENNDEAIIKEILDMGISVYELDYDKKINCLLKAHIKIEQIVVTDDVDILHGQSFMSDIIISNTKSDVKKITTIHNRTYDDYIFLFGNFKGRLVAKIHLRVLQKFDKCICCSKSVQDEERKYLKNTMFIQNGVEIVENKTDITRNELGIPDDAMVYIYTGSLSKRKNVVHLVELFLKAHSENDYMLILGTGEEERECRELIDNNIIMLGYISNPAQYYQISNVYISASLAEGLSLSQLESLEYNLGQLVFDIPSHREVVDQDKEYYVGEVFNDLDFMEKFNIVGRKVRLGMIKSKKLYEKYFTNYIMCRNYEDAYIKIGEVNNER